MSSAAKDQEILDQENENEKKNFQPDPDENKELTDRFNLDVIPYLKVGNDYWKMIRFPLKHDTITVLSSISRYRFNDELGSRKNEVKQFDAFCNIPDNLNYERVHYPLNPGPYDYGAFNLYEPINHIPKEGTWDTIKSVLQHIFQEHYILSLDYLTILFRHPDNFLPILCLVSTERNTGKTTFINFLKCIYGANMTLNSNDDFRSNFNSSWASKLIIAIDEVSLDDPKDSERIKALSTTRTIKIEAKGKDRTEIQFFGKFILSANKETDFIKIDSEEIRFWVRKVPPLTKEIVNMGEKLKLEIPGFLHYLINRKIETPNEHRMWFKPSLIHTEALDRVKRGTASRLEKEIRYIINQLFFLLPDEKEIELTNSDIRDTYYINNARKIGPSEVDDIITGKWGIKKSANKRYMRLNIVSEQDSLPPFDSYSKVTKASATGTPFLFLKQNFLTI